ncbi:MAG: hypothetical protein EZS28_009665 [Streblomastix strix]|uniref:Uncharacterized protein n=1 Tax=Streblomastix strix TaxID=222440 RepID=A0A5J4WIY9_9EUKA|nr:MAG: hypothetical protein EZS28_009665 [Streblomastix strix]
MSDIDDQEEENGDDYIEEEDIDQEFKDDEDYEFKEDNPDSYDYNDNKDPDDIKGLYKDDDCRSYQCPNTIHPFSTMVERASKILLYMNSSLLLSFNAND